MSSTIAIPALGHASRSVPERQELLEQVAETGSPRAMTSRVPLCVQIPIGRRASPAIEKRTDHGAPSSPPPPHYTESRTGPRFCAGKDELAPGRGRYSASLPQLCHGSIHAAAEPRNDQLVTGPQTGPEAPGRKGPSFHRPRMGRGQASSPKSADERRCRVPERWCQQGCRRIVSNERRRDCEHRCPPWTGDQQVNDPAADSQAVHRCKKAGSEARWGAGTERIEAPSPCGSLPTGW